MTKCNQIVNTSNGYHSYTKTERECGKPAGYRVNTINEKGNAEVVKAEDGKLCKAHATRRADSRNQAIARYKR